MCAKMDCDKQGSSDEHYAGGSLQPFDRNSKSRKRLFSSEYDLPEQIKQGTRDSKSLEKFHMEILTPTSAKSTPVTHHKLIFPIKTPGFVASGDGARVVETTARVIDPLSQATIRSEVSVAGSSSVSMKGLKLKGKSEVARRPSNSHVDVSAASSSKRGQPTAKRCSSSADEVRNAIVKNKGTSISLAVQAKINIQRKEGLSSRNRSVDGQEESIEVEPSPSLSKTEPHSLESTNKKHSAHSNSAVLRANKQKQNDSIANEKPTSKTSVPDLLGWKTSAFCGYSRKLISETRGCENAILNSEVENVPQKKQLEPSRHVGERTTRPVFNQDEEGVPLSSDDMKFSSPGDKGIGTDALRILLDRKLREYSSNNAAMRNTEECPAPSPVSVLGLSVLAESCSSSDSEASNSTQESQHSSSHCREVYDSSTTKDSISEAGTDLSDSASSSLLGNFSASSSEWELDYIKDVLCNVELMFKDYTLGRTREVMNPHFFDRLEKKRITRFKAYGGESRLERKIMFDCVRQCLGSRCQHLARGSYKVWAKGVAMVSAKGTLAEEVYKEIQSWRSMGNCIVDELVDSDMSSRYWHDFRIDQYTLGVEIENHICDSLIDEVLADIVRIGGAYSFNSASVM